jgi:hypothetical protein
MELLFLCQSFNSSSEVAAAMLLEVRVTLLQCCGASVMLVCDM